MSGKGKGSRAQRGKQIACGGQGFSARQAVGVVASGELCETGEAVRDSFDGAEPGRACANRGEEGGQNRGGGFVAPIAEEAGETDTEDGASEPGLFFTESGMRASLL